MHKPLLILNLLIEYIGNLVSGYRSFHFSLSVFFLFSLFFFFPQNSAAILWRTVTSRQPTEYPLRHQLLHLHRSWRFNVRIICRILALADKVVLQANVTHYISVRDELREHLKNTPKVIMAQKPEAEQKKPALTSSSSESSSESSDSDSDSSESSSDSSSEGGGSSSSSSQSSVSGIRLI